MKPLKMKKGRTTLVRTPYGSYVNEADDGMAQQKNAISYKEAIRFGYKPYASM